MIHMLMASSWPIEDNQDINPTSPIPILTELDSQAWFLLSMIQKIFFVKKGHMNFWFEIQMMTHLNQ